MNQLTRTQLDLAPLIVARSAPNAEMRFLEFFAAAIRNTHTRRAYFRAATNFLAWCETEVGISTLAAVQPIHVASWIELQTRIHTPPTVKQQLAAIRHLFDWMVTGQIMPTNPAASVRGPAHRIRRGKTPILSPQEARTLLDSIDVSTAIGLRDRALIALMIYSFARIGAALQMRVSDVYTQDRRLWVRLHEKGGKEHAMPCHHSLEQFLHEYIEQCGLGAEPRTPLFRTVDRRTKQLSSIPLAQSNAHAMVRRRAADAGIATALGNHSFRATGITAYLKNGGTLERAATMANHSSTRTTQLYDRRPDDVTLDEVERVMI